MQDEQKSKHLILCISISWNLEKLRFYKLPLSGFDRLFVDFDLMFQTEYTITNILTSLVEEIKYAIAQGLLLEQILKFCVTSGSTNFYTIFLLESFRNLVPLEVLLNAYFTYICTGIYCLWCNCLEVFYYCQQNNCTAETYNTWDIRQSDQTIQKTDKYTFFGF